MATVFAYTKRPRRPSITYPDLGPWAGVLFLLCAVFMAAAKFEYPAPRVRLPLTATRHTNGMREIYMATISMDVDGRLYIAVDNEKLQTAIIQQVAKRHHVQFTAAQLQELRKMPFLSQDIQRLPYWLSASKAERSKFLLGIPTNPDNNQLVEYLETSVAVSKALYNRPIFFALRADERLKFWQVKQVFNLLQKYDGPWLHYIAKENNAYHSTKQAYFFK